MMRLRQGDLAAAPLARGDGEESEGPNRFRAAFVAILCGGVPLLLWLGSAQSSASFSDAEILDDNRLGAATLDIELGSTETGLDSPESGEAVFEARNLAPGDVVSGQLEINNVGSLPASLSLSAVSSGGLLADWLLFSVWSRAEACHPGDLNHGVGTALATEFQIGADNTESVLASEPLLVAPGADVVLCLGARLPLDAGNDVQGQRLVVTLVIDAVHDVEATP